MKHLRNERGILTLDFIFALTIGMCFTIVFFAITMTLSLVEVTQYLSFAVARASWAAHQTPEAQRDLGTRKYNELRDKPVFQAIFNRGWFTLPAEPDFGHPTLGFNQEYSPSVDNEIFHGARLHIQAKILNVNIPFLGSSTTSPETGAANVQTFLGREVTTEECMMLFNQARWDEIQRLHGSYGEVSTHARPGSTRLFADNGC
ncbi:MAG: hypothetical protein RBT63_05195 [Bdellovibrionales bacterium]|jgi:hypothetical protein|nr:hypothetical protein [Bdellovibrionales bacterium]